MSPYFFHMNNHDYQYGWPHGEIPYTFLFCLLFLHINLFYFIELFFINGPNFVLVPRLNLSGDVYTNAQLQIPAPMRRRWVFFLLLCVLQFTRHHILSSHPSHHKFLFLHIESEDIPQMVDQRTTSNSTYDHKVRYLILFINFWTKSFDYFILPIHVLPMSMSSLISLPLDFISWCPKPNSHCKHQHNKRRLSIDILTVYLFIFKF